MVSAVSEGNAPSDKGSLQDGLDSLGKMARILDHTLLRKKVILR